MVEAEAAGFLDLIELSVTLRLEDQLDLRQRAQQLTHGLPTLAPLGHEDAYSPCLTSVELVDAVAVAVARTVEDYSVKEC